MFLLERLIGVGIYSLLLILACISLIGKKEKTIRLILFFYSVILAIFAYNYIPHETADLYRIYGYIESFQKYSFAELWEVQVTHSDIGYATILYWLIAKIGIPQLLPALVTFICYSCVFYIIGETAKRNKISGKNVAIALFFYMSTGTYIFVISGIRCMLGISLLSFCFYRESVIKKFKFLHIPLYVIAALIHSFSIVLIAVRCVIPILDTKTTLVKKIIYFIFWGAGLVIVFLNFGELLNKVVLKAESYLSGGKYSYVWDYLVAVITGFILVSIIIKSKKILAKSILKLNIFRFYLIGCFLMALFFFYEFSIFHRTIVYILPIISLPLLLTTLQISDNARAKPPTKHIESFANRPISYGFTIVFISAIILLISCTRGSLCSLKFFVL